MSWPTPNEHGVYQATEALEMPAKGDAYARIRLCHIEAGWLWAITYQTNTGGGTGPLSIHQRCYAATRADAIAGAVTEMRCRLASHSRLRISDLTNERCVAAIEAWLDGIERQQAEPTLFDMVPA